MIPAVSRSIALVFLIAAAACGRTTEVILTCPSPDNRASAIFFWVHGGGAAGWAFFRLAVQPVDQQLDPEKFAFEMRHGSDIRLRWKTNSELFVEYPDKGDVKVRRDTVEIGPKGRDPVPGSVHLTYTPVPTAPAFSLEGGSKCFPPEGG